MSATSLNGGAALVYDAAGDVTGDGLNSYLYDAEGRLCAVLNYVGALTGYVYDAGGTRVAKGPLSSFSCNFASNGFTPATSWVLGPGGEQVTEYAVSGGAGAWAHTNVFAGGKPLATYRDTNTYFALTDWLGTKRVEVGASGCASAYASMAYGDGLTPVPLPGYAACPSDATEHHFTGKERDTESGNDYFEARYYSSSMGRFMSPDWSEKEEPIPYAKLDNPQTLNLYAYVGNNPLIHVDADGHVIEYEKGVKPPTDKKELALLKRIDAYYGGKKEIIVSSGYRDPARNEAAGGAKDSYHIKGMAADFHVPGQTPEQVAAVAVKEGAGGVSTYDGSTGGGPRVHADVRSGEWNGSNGKTMKSTPEWRSNPDKILGTTTSNSGSSGGWRQVVQTVTDFLISHF